MWNSSLNRIQTHDLCDTSVVLYQGSYQANWELVTLWVRNIPVHGEETKWIYERPHYIWTAVKNMKICLVIAVMRWSLHWTIISSYLSLQFKYMVFHVVTFKDDECLKSCQVNLYFTFFKGFLRIFWNKQTNKTHVHYNKEVK